MGRPVIGKRELLQWASITSGKPCQRLEDLQDGSVLLRIFGKIWPQAFKGREERLKIHMWDVKRNWEALRSLFLELRLPLHVFDPAGIQRSAFKPCFAILVLCFFLQQLAGDRSFSCDFAYPIDQTLADFLQSRGSIASLDRHGSLKDNKDAARKEDGMQEGGAQQKGESVVVEVSRKAFTRQDSGRARQNSHMNGEPLASGLDHQSGGLRKENEGSLSPERKLSYPGNPEVESGQGMVEWRTAGMRVKGELLLANLRFENDSLRRQMEASVQERHFLVTRYEQECKEAAAVHESELQSQAEALRGEFAVERLKLAAERGRDQQRFVLELRKVADGLRAEAQRASKGEDAQPSVEEMSKLKQQLLASACARAVQEDQTAALERRCASLEEEIGRRQEEDGRLHRELSVGCKAEIDSSQLLAVEDETEAQTLTSTGREAALLRQLRKMARDATQAELARQRVEEELKLKVWKLEQCAREGNKDANGETFGALLEEFDEEHTSERLRSEVKRLHTDNNFLRERAAVFDRYNLRTHKPDASDGSKKDPAMWLPRERVSKTNEEDERVAAELLELLKAALYGKALVGDRQSETPALPSPKEEATPGPRIWAKRAVELFWKMVVAQTVLKQRVGRAALEMRALREGARAAERQRAVERHVAEERLEALEERHKEELLAVTNGSRQETALLAVKKGLLENEVADLHCEMDEAMVEIRRSRTAAQQQHEEKFQLLKKRLRESRSETSQLRLKEQHYARLASCHREAAALCEHVAITAMTIAGPAFQPGLSPDQVVSVRCAPRGTVDEIRALIKTKADLDAQAAACLDGIKAVENVMGVRERVSEREADDLDQVVGEATEVLKAEVLRLEKALEASRQKADALTVRAADLEIAVKQKEGQLATEGALKAHARKEAERLHAANAKLQKRLVEQKELVEQEVSRLHVQLMEAMMRLDEQSAILDASMRLGMMHVPPEQEPESEEGMASEASAADGRVEKDSDKDWRAEGGRNRKKGLGTMQLPDPDREAESEMETEIKVGRPSGGSVEVQRNEGERNGGGRKADGHSEGGRRLERGPVRIEQNGLPKIPKAVSRLSREQNGRNGIPTVVVEDESEAFGYGSTPTLGEGDPQLSTEALGVPRAQKWTGELLEIADEDAWEERARVSSMGLEVEDDYHAAECREAEEMPCRRYRVASLTPIPENDSQDSPEGADTWHGEDAGHPPETERNTGREGANEEESLLFPEEEAERSLGLGAEREGAEQEECRLDPGRGTKRLSEMGRRLECVMGGEKDSCLGQAEEMREPGGFVKGGSKVAKRESSFSMKQPGEESGFSAEETLDPIVEMIRRMSQVSVPGGPLVSEEGSLDDAGVEADRNGAEAEAGGGAHEQTTAVRSNFGSAQQSVLVSSNDNQSRAPEAKSQEAADPESPTRQEFEASQTSARESSSENGTDFNHVVSWDSSDQEWVEKKVVGSSSPGTKNDGGSLGNVGSLDARDVGGSRENVGGFRAHEEHALDGRPAAFSMHSHMLPDYVVEWDPGTPIERTAGSTLRSPVSPPAYALPDMA